MTIKVNIMPREKKRPGLDPVTIVLFLALTAGSLGMLAYARMLSVRIAEARGELGRVEGEAQKLEEQLPGLAQREERIRKLESQIASIKSLKDDPLRYSRLLVMVAEALPETIWLESLAIEPGRETVSITGTVAGPLPMGTLAGLVRALRDTRVFDRTDLKTATRKDKTFSFQLEAHYKPDAAAKEL